ncbi:hypothetical protein GN956_G10733 [Arapaima gigas]
MNETGQQEVVRASSARQVGRSTEDHRTPRRSQVSSSTSHPDLPPSSTFYNPPSPGKDTYTAQPGGWDRGSLLRSAKTQTDGGRTTRRRFQKPQ